MFFFRRDKNDNIKKDIFYEDSLFRTNISILMKNIDMNSKEKENNNFFHKK